MNHQKKRLQQQATPGDLCNVSNAVKVDVAVAVTVDVAAVVVVGIAGSTSAVQGASTFGVHVLVSSGDDNRERPTGRTKHEKKG